MVTISDEVGKHKCNVLEINLADKYTIAALQMSKHCTFQYYFNAPQNINVSHKLELVPTEVVLLCYFWLAVSPYRKTIGPIICECTFWFWLRNWSYLPLRMKFIVGIKWCNVWDKQSPLPCEQHGPRASVTTETSAFGLGFCCNYWVPRTMFFTRHGRPWSIPTKQYI